MAVTWRVQVGHKLSKSYTVDQLRQKRANGVVTALTPCTQDDGNSFVDLATVLAEAQGRQQRDAAPSGRAEVRRKARLQQVAPRKTGRPQTPQSPLRAPAPESTELLQGLIQQASVAVAESDDVGDAPDESAEIYTIPEPPPMEQSCVPEYPDPQPSAIALAAAKALQAEEEKSNDDQVKLKPGERPRASASAPDKSKPVSTGQRTVEKAKFGLRQILIFTTVAAGLGAAALLVHWFGTTDGPPAFQDLTNGSLALSTFDADDPVTIEEVHARTQILGVQVSQITRAIMAQTDATAATAVELPELPSIPQMPMVPFQQRSLTSAEQSTVDTMKERYSELVQEKGPDGRDLDETTVAAFSEYLMDIVNVVDSAGPDRTTALHELSEWVKLMYLLQLGRLESRDTEARQLAIQQLLEASNSGLALLYSELSTGDMRFADVFDRSNPAEQSRLLLTRYWYHRAINRTVADEWLAEVLLVIDTSAHQLVRDSIAEVDSIEQ